MLPYIDAEQRDEARGGLERVLIGSGGHGQAVVHLVVAEPAPPRSLHGYGRRGDSILQVLEAAVLGVDGLQELRVAEIPATLADRSKVLPEDGVVQVAATYYAAES
jgi:exopolyphosphatase/pppGpp-phosphohydrolase